MDQKIKNFTKAKLAKGSSGQFISYNNVLFERIFSLYRVTNGNTQKVNETTDFDSAYINFCVQSGWDDATPSAPPTEVELFAEQVQFEIDSADKFVMRIDPKLIDYLVSKQKK